MSESPSPGPTPDELRAARFEEAVDAVVDGRAARLEELLALDPALARAPSPRPHRATLLHYLAANGVEDSRQRSPGNAVQIAEILLDAGADVDALAEVYGGHCTTLTLLVSSYHPAAAGVQAELAGLLLDRGSRESIPAAVRLALSFGYLETARFLADRTSAPADLATCAGLGRTTEVRRLIPSAAAPERHAALALAALHGHAAVLRLLLDAGEDPNRLNPPGHHPHSTPLHQAAHAGHREAVELLVERGARLDIADSIHGGTPLDWARHTGRGEIAAFLSARAARAAEGAPPHDSEAGDG